MGDAAAVDAAARRADITFDSLGGPIASAVLEAMNAGSVFVGYGLLSGQNIRSYERLRASYQRFHLRDTLAGMTASEWQCRFALIWPALGSLALPPVRLFPLADWRSALEQASRPAAEKSMLYFD